MNSGFSNYRLIHLAGRQFLNYHAAPVLYAIIVIAALLIGLRKYKRMQAIEERFRARGGKRKIEFRRQEDTRLEDIESGLILPNGAGDGEIILRSKKAYEDRRPEMGDREKALNGNLPV